METERILEGLMGREEISVQTHGGPVVFVMTLNTELGMGADLVLLDVNDESVLLNKEDIDRLIKALTAAKLLNEIHTD